MRFCIYYWLIEPLRGGISDNDEKEPSIDLDISWKGENYKFSLICDEDSAPKFARLQIPCESGEEIPEVALPLITIIREHLLSTLKLTWRDDIRLFPMVSWVFWDDKDPRSFNIEVDMYGKDIFDKYAASAIFQHAMPIREEIKLYIDGIDDHIPPQYRFLAFYKLLEMHFKKNGVWNEENLSSTLESFKNYYEGQACEKSYINELHSLRDKCAHISTGKGKREVLGVTQLNHKESVRVHNMLPMLREICRGIINQYSEGKFVLGEYKPWYERIATTEPGSLG